MKKYFALAAMLLTPAFGFAAEHYDLEGPLKTAYADSLVIVYAADNAKSDDANADRAGELAITFDANTHYTNFAKISDLKEGDEIGINYRQGTSTKNVADSITRIDVGDLPVDTETVTQQTTTVTTVTTTNAAVTTAP